MSTQPTGLYVHSPWLIRSTSFPMSHSLPVPVPIVPPPFLFHSLATLSPFTLTTPSTPHYSPHTRSLRPHCSQPALSSTLFRPSQTVHNETFLSDSVVRERGTGEHRMVELCGGWVGGYWLLDDWDGRLDTRWKEADMEEERQAVRASLGE